MLYPWKIIPGDGVSFELLEDNKTIKVSAAAEVAATPVLTYDEHGVLTATCETEGAMILFTAYFGGLSVVCAYDGPLNLDDFVLIPIKFWAQKGGMSPSDYVSPTYPPFFRFDKYKSKIMIDDFNQAKGEIFYTLDGSDPIENGIAYDGLPIVILEPCTVKAVILFKDGTYSTITTKEIHALSIDIEVNKDYGNNTVIAEAHVFDEKGYAVSADVYYSIGGADPSAGSHNGNNNYYEQSIYGEENTVKFIAYADDCIPATIVTCGVGEEKVQPPTITFEQELDGSILAYIDGIPEGGTGYFDILYSLAGANFALYTEPFSVSTGDNVTAYIVYLVTQQASDYTAEYVK